MSSVTLRAYEPKKDEAFIYSTWTRNTYYAQKSRLSIEKKAWFKHKSAQIKEMLETAKVYIACLKEDPSLIIGYFVTQNNRLVWAYIKKDYREQGIEDLFNRKLQEH